MEWAVFVIFAVAALGGAGGVVMARKPVHAAMSLVLTLFAVAVFFVMQSADFLAAVQVIVYAGAVVVLFLFVIMLLGVESEDILEEPLPAQRPLAVVVGLAMISGLLLVAGAYYLTVAAIVFTIGAVGLLVRRNALIMFMCVELMLNAVNLTFVTFARMLDDIGGQVFVFFTLVVGAAEGTPRLRIHPALFRPRQGATADDVSLLRGSTRPSTSPG